MKNADIGETVAASHHLEDFLDIFAVADPHRIENRIFDGGQQQLGTFPGGGDKVLLLPPDMKKGKGPDDDRQQEDVENDDPTDETFKKQRTSR
jgi:hypothetical protein